MILNSCLNLKGYTNMKISLNWLKEFIPSIKSKEIFDDLTSMGLEVSSVNKTKNDVIIDIDMTPNRADCLSIYGIARDLSSLYKVSIKQPDYDKLIKSNVIKTKDIEPGIAPSYRLLTIMGINNKNKTPSYILERLSSSGISQVNFIVDILNYVMIEIGQPMHAFDMDNFMGNIKVRFAKSGERINALNSEVYKLSPSISVITDDSNIQAIAGVIGSEDSSVSSSSTNIMIESAYFIPNKIRIASKLMRLQTDASYRFERGVDPLLNLYALKRVIFLVKKHTQYVKVALSHKLSKNLPRHINNKIKFPYDLFESSLGQSIPKKFIINTLKYLGFNPFIKNSNLIVNIPSHRFDISAPHDLVEEVARVYGYNNFEPLLLTNKVRNNIDKCEIKNSYSKLLSARGYNEVISYSFLPRESQNYVTKNKKNIITIKNPISEDKAELRSSMFHSMLSIYKYNFNRQNINLKIYELGRIYIKGTKGEIKETDMLSGLASGLNSELNIKNNQNKLSFLDIKGDLISIFGDMQLKPCEKYKYLESSCQALIYKNNKIVGHCGAVNVDLAETSFTRERIYYFELTQAALVRSKDIKYKEISVYPKIKRDLTILIDDNFFGQDIIDAIERKSFNYMINIRISDIFYNKEEISNKIKSITFEFMFQDKKSTLTDKTVNDEMKKIIIYLTDKFNSKIKN